METKRWIYVALMMVLLAGTAHGRKKDKDKEQKRAERREKLKMKQKQRISIAGQYVLETDPADKNYGEYLKAMEYSEDAQKEIQESQKTMVEIQMLNQTHWNVKRVTQNNITHEWTFESGTEFTGKLLDGREQKTVITVNDNEKTVQRVICMEGFNATHDLEFSKKGFSIKLSAKEASANLIFKRWKGRKGAKGGKWGKKGKGGKMEKGDKDKEEKNDKGFLGLGGIFKGVGDLFKPKKEGGDNEKQPPNKKEEKEEEKGKDKETEEEESKEEGGPTTEKNKANKDEEEPVSTTTEEAKKEEKSLIPGEYILETDPDNEVFSEYLKAMDYSDETQESLRKTKKILMQFKMVDKTNWQVIRITKKKTWNVTFQSGQEFPVKLPGGAEKNMIFTIDEKGNKVNCLIKMEGFEANHDYIFDKEGFNITLNAKGASAMLEYDRLGEPGSDVGDIMEAFRDYSKDGEATTENNMDKVPGAGNEMGENDDKPKNKADKKKGPTIAGEYVLETDPAENEDLNKYMNAMGLSEETQDDIRENDVVLVQIRKVDERNWQIHRMTKKKTWSVSFESGVEFRAKLPGGREKDTTITMDEEGAKAYRVIKMGDFEATHEVQFGKKGFVITMMAKDATVKMEFSKWKPPAGTPPDARLEAFKAHYFGK